MNTQTSFFTQKLSIVSAGFIRHLRLERQLDFPMIYELATCEYK
jgi:hypothetical protein